MVLYRKFRPQNFASIKEQYVITDILRSAIIHKKIAHAYLFTGTRGTGKTTTARVFARAINCIDPKDGEPCDICEVCRSFNEGRNVDLIEIDAASNRGIDDIREIKEKVNFAPVMSTYKVYIIDEVHMLTKDAFNALLKTLEEPPHSVVFILATTEIYKVPLTIISRCQKFDFKNASTNELIKLLNEVAKKEKIDITDDAIELVADLAEGSFRDSLSIFEKLHSIADTITYEKALEIVGIPDDKAIMGVLLAIIDGNIPGSLNTFKEALDRGVDLYQFNKQVLKLLEKYLMQKARGEKTKYFSTFQIQDIMFFIKEFLAAEESLKYAAVPMVIIEATIVSLAQRYANTREDPAKQESPAKQEKVERVAYDLPPVKQQKLEKELSDDPPDLKKVSELPVRDTVTVHISKNSDAGVEPTPARSEVEGNPANQAKQESPAKQESLNLEIKEPKKMSAKSSEGDISIDIIVREWTKLITKVTPFNSHLGSFLAKSNPVSIEENTVIMEVKYSFHKDRIEDMRSKEAFANVCEQCIGVRLMPKCVVNAKLNISHIKSASQPMQHATVGNGLGMGAQLGNPATQGSPATQGFEKKHEMTDNVHKQNVSIAGSSEDDILEEAMKIFEME